MPRSKEVLAQEWAEKSEEERNQIRKKTAERIRIMRAKKGQKKRSEMDPDELAKERAKDRYKKMQKRKKMTEEKKEKIRARNRENMARKRSQNRANKKNKKDLVKKKKKHSAAFLLGLGEKRMKQLMNNCRIQSKIEAKRTQEQMEEIQVKKVEKMREKRLEMSEIEDQRWRIQARQWMREWRNHGFLREYKQRKRRNSLDPRIWSMESHAISEYFDKVKEVETKQERNEELRRMNRIRVERHRMKVKRILQEPVIIENYGEKGEYELLRDKNIQEFERLKKESGLFF